MCGNMYSHDRDSEKKVNVKKDQPPKQEPVENKDKKKVLSRA